MSGDSSNNREEAVGSRPLGHPRPARHSIPKAIHCTAQRNTSRAQHHATVITKLLLDKLVPNILYLQI